MRFNLAAAGHYIIRSNSKDKPPPIQTHGIDLNPMDECPDGMGVSLDCRSDDKFSQEHLPRRE